MSVATAPVRCGPFSRLREKAGDEGDAERTARTCIALRAWPPEPIRSP